jgi:hypothetical protein
MTLLQTTGRLLRGAAQAVLIGLLLVYRYAVSPVLHMLAPGGGCRFTPSCSEYAMEAVRRHGPLGGAWLAARRVVRCHPWGGHGYDPVPHTCSCASRKDHHDRSPLKPAGEPERRPRAHPHT